MNKLPEYQKPFTASDLPIDEEGRIYHLQIKPEQIAPDILIVGDPGRADFIGSNFLCDLELEHENRGLMTVTGTSTCSGELATIISPVRACATTSGMGTPSLEIVLNELVALNEIDFETRTRKLDYPRLHIIRVGSSGGLQASTKLDTPIITTYAIGIDNTGLFYESPFPDEICDRLETQVVELINNSMNPLSRFQGMIHPYVSRTEPILVKAMLEISEKLGIFTKAGLTISAPGFFNPQGREISRVKSGVPELDKLFAEFDPGLDGQQVENMEMETSFLAHFLGGMGYWAGSICPAIANRRQDTFSSQYQDGMWDAINIALLALAQTRERFPDSSMR
ncbi:MAG: nucleoside phosphorylase [Anaerolineales bacterium]